MNGWKYVRHCWMRDHMWKYNAQRGWAIVSRKEHPEGERIRCHFCNVAARYSVEVPGEVTG